MRHYMKIISINLNGIRAAARKGFFEWLALQEADVVCLQETKAQVNSMDSEPFKPEGYHCYFHDAEKKGYSGVGLFAREEPTAVHYGLGWPSADTEGRYIQADFGRLSVASLYLPSGSSRDERQQVKFDFMDKYLEKLYHLRKEKKEYIICGDWNIAHKQIDLKNWKSNQKNSGFLPEERAWMDELFGDAGFVDAFREVNQEADQYTWWSNRGQAWAKNVGWRLDYQVVTPGLKAQIIGASIYKEQRFSDHAPLLMEYDLSFSSG